MKTPSHSLLLRALTLAVLLCAFGAAWTHVHAQPQEQDQPHACLLCQWTGTPASLSASSAVPVALHVQGHLLVLSDPGVSQTFCDSLRSRSPPSISFS